MFVNCATRLKVRHFVVKIQFKSNEAWIKMAQDAEWSVKMCTYQEKVLGYVHNIPDSFCACTKTIPDTAFVQTQER